MKIDVRKNAAELVTIFHAIWIVLVLGIIITFPSSPDLKGYAAILIAGPVLSWIIWHECVLVKIIPRFHSRLGEIYAKTFLSKAIRRVTGIASDEQFFTAGVLLYILALLWLIFYY